MSKTLNSFKVVYIENEWKHEWKHSAKKEYFIKHIYYIPFSSIILSLQISLNNISYKYIEGKNSQTYYCCYIYKNI